MRILIYNKIRELREDRDWTQQHVADLLFINRRTYSAYENGVNAISPEILMKLSEIYQTSVDYLLGLTDEKKPYPKKRAL
ncbi:helix-turn-helix domain-containing protein [Caproiciproducens sp. R1]|uniref:helix-turn-helix domain-containing protein n=1 Tax=Caproiciproducens sp. R1 TaxID=3435000 RepID=UPI0040339EA9